MDSWRKISEAVCCRERDHLLFECLEQGKAHIQEIARAARRIEYLHLRQPLLKLREYPMETLA